MPEEFELRILGSEAVEGYAELLAQSFLADRDSEQADLARVGYEHGRLLYRGEDLAGGLILIPMAQWFGGRAVNMTGIASVAIAPHHRGRGAALALMEKCLQELHSQQVALSTLYPAAQALYYKAGYGQAGLRCRWQVATTAIQVHRLSLPVHRLPMNPQGLMPVYDQQARINPGCLQRSPVIWQRILTSEKSPLYGYGFGPENALEGYIVFTQTRSPQGTVLQIRDWAVTSEAAAQSLWGFLNGHRSQIDTVVWHGGGVDWLGRSLPEQTSTQVSSMAWMTRIIHVEQALLQRGYPSVDAELHLNIQDGLLAGNNGLFVLTVSQGQPSIQRGGHGDVELSIDHLATLYTGLWTAQQLHQMGALRASPSALAMASLLFNGAVPWMPDFF